MEKLCGKFVRCIINYFSSLYKLHLLFCLSLRDLLESFLFKLEIQHIIHVIIIL